MFSSRRNIVVLNALRKRGILVKETTFLSSLYPELLQEVFSFCSNKVLVNLMISSKHNYRLIEMNKNIWKNRYFILNRNSISCFPLRKFINYGIVPKGIKIIEKDDLIEGKPDVKTATETFEKEVERMRIKNNNFFSLELFGVNTKHIIFLMEIYWGHMFLESVNGIYFDDCSIKEFLRCNFPNLIMVEINNCKNKNKIIGKKCAEKLKIFDPKKLVVFKKFSSSNFKFQVLEKEILSEISEEHEKLLKGIKNDLINVNPSIEIPGFNETRKKLIGLASVKKGSILPILKNTYGELLEYINFAEEIDKIGNDSRLNYFNHLKEIMKICEALFFYSEDFKMKKKIFENCFNTVLESRLNSFQGYLESKENNEVFSRAAKTMEKIVCYMKDSISELYEKENLPSPLICHEGDIKTDFYINDDDEFFLKEENFITNDEEFFLEDENITTNNEFFSCSTSDFVQAKRLKNNIT